MKNVKFKKYAHIPKSCQAGNKDLFDHQLYHKIFHSRCKFCRDDSCFIENCVTFTDIKTTNKDVETEDMFFLLQSFCFKICKKKAWIWYTQWRKSSMLYLLKNISVREHFEEAHRSISYRFTIFLSMYSMHKDTINWADFKTPCWFCPWRKIHWM